jgi:hypothetical protein
MASALRNSDKGRIDLTRVAYRDAFESDSKATSGLFEFTDPYRSFVTLLKRKATTELTSRRRELCNVVKSLS